MSPWPGAFAVVCAALALLVAIVVFIRHEIDAMCWRRYERAVGGKVIARQRLIVAEEQKKRDDALQVRLDDALARKAFEAAQRRNVLPFPRITSRGRPARFDSPPENAA